MLVLFIGIMVYVVSVAEQARSIKDSALTFREGDLKKNLVEQKNAAASDYNVAQLLKVSQSNWEPSKQRESFDPKNPSVEGTFSDLVAAVKIASCPHCKKLIPRYYFRNKVSCPICAVELADVPNRPKERRLQVSENDRDGDGMPNSYETSKNFNPDSPDDQLADADRDGFSNLYEYENETDPVDPRSRSPLWYRLRYITLDSVVLPIKFRSISTQNQLKDKSRWILQFSRPVYNRRGQIIFDNGKPRESSSDHFIGGEIRIEDVNYKIVDATYDVKKVGKDNYVDRSSVKLEQILPKDAKNKPDVLVMQAEKEVRSNDKRLVLEDVGTPILNQEDKGRGNGRSRFVIRVGQTIRIGNRATRMESYRLRQVDERAKTALFERPGVTSGDPTKDAAGKKILVTVESEIPEDVQVKNVKPQTTMRQGVDRAGRPLL